jgi:hypothetical protein
MNTPAMPEPIYHVVTYTGPFGFIKPWTAVRDGETFSQTYLTPSIIEGMRQKLGVSSIERHRLAHAGISRQQEQVHSVGWKSTKSDGGKALKRGTGIITRGVMLRPRLYLAFFSEADAERAASDHLCLCRNEDVVLPIAVDEAMVPKSASGKLVRVLREQDFDQLIGFEMRFKDGPGTIPLGYNRYAEGQPMMRGRLVIKGDAANEGRHVV